MIDREKLYEALREMGSVPLKPPRQNIWTPERPTTGYCYVVSEVIYYYLKPNGYRPYMMMIGQGTHWFLKNSGGDIIDLTADQFDEPPDYRTARRASFKTKHPSRRAKRLARLLGLE